jgi:hypothetical protein
MTDPRQNTETPKPLDLGHQLMNAVLIGEPAPEIVALESQIRAAQLAGDVAALDHLISDNLLFTGHDG